MVNTNELEPGTAYEVTGGPKGQPRGRAVFVRMAGLRTAICTFPDTGRPEVEWPVATSAIVARWDDPARVEARRQVMALVTRAAEARRVLAEAGLDVQDKGRQPSAGPAEAVVGPGMGRWNVTIELAAFCDSVMPLLQLGIKRRAYDTARRVRR